MNAEKKKIKRRYAYKLEHTNGIVIDVTPQEYEQITKGRIGLEIVKQTPRMTVYRIKK